MKHTICSLHTCTALSDTTITATGEGGAITVTFLTPTIINIAYHFAPITIEQSLVEASAYLTEPAGALHNEHPVTIHTSKSSFTLQCEDTTVVLERSLAQVSIWYKGVLQHGGRVGTADTVLPDHQVRCFTREGSPASFARFNFPLEEEDEFYGLGDKSGVPDKRGRRFSMFNRDSLGYDASLSDPLYKSIPFLLKVNNRAKTLCGLFFNQSLINYFDLGQESPFFFSVEVEGGPYEYYAIVGDTYHDIIASYHCITGLPFLPPLFSFGFFGSSMNYVEPDDAQERILDYFATIEKYAIPCEGMYVSSGYLKSPEGKRYAFHWNKQKFPDHKAFLTSLSSRGYNLCMNIKPGILLSHPWYEMLKERGYFIKAKDGQPYQEFFWGGEASFIDFNNSEAKEWWKSQLQEQYLDHGCTGIWNDNNELELEDVELEAYPTRTLYPIKMAEASYEVFKQHHPQRRPWIYSRSGYAGLQRFARTWTGDNVSDWKTLKYNQYMGIGLGLSGLPFFGHDLGGFFGSFPEEELLVRSCQSAVLQGRFVIHSWREDGNPTEPWSYPSALEPIRSLIIEHYRFMPYIYTCAYQSAVEGVPIERSLHLEFPEDENIRSDEINSLFGPNLLKVIVTDKGVRSAVVHLPRGLWWYDRDGVAHQGGTTLEVDYPYNGPSQWFAREGSVIPTAATPTHLESGIFDAVEHLVYPCIGESTPVRSLYFEDDGSSELSYGRYNLWHFEVTESELTIIKVVGGLEKKRTFTFTAAPGYTLSQTTVDPDDLDEGERLTIAISR